MKKIALAAIFIAISSAVGAKTYEVGSATEFASAVSAINAAGENGETEFTISVTNDIGGIGMTAIAATNKTVTLKGNGHTLSLANQNWACLGINAGTLNLGDADDVSGLTITRDGGSGSFPLLYVNRGTTAQMYSGTTITGNESSYQLGGGVVVYGGTFNMHGGEIANCGSKAATQNKAYCGGGVAVVEGGYFKMDGGSIKNCYVDSNNKPGNNAYAPVFCGGGVLVYNASAFEMNGGTIEGCRVNGSTLAGTVDYGMGGGVAIIASAYETTAGQNAGAFGSTFEMNGGAITNCTASYYGGGVAALGTYIKDLDVVGCSEVTAKAHNKLAGVFLNGGSIDGCSAGTAGGGAYYYDITDPDDYYSLYGISKTMISNVVVKSCSAANGGGIAVASGAKTWLELIGTKLLGNSATSNGGGIYMTGENSYAGRTILSSVTITGNHADGSAGGVSYDDVMLPYFLDSCIVTNNTYAYEVNGNTYEMPSNVYVPADDNGEPFALPIYGDLTGSKIGLLYSGSIYDYSGALTSGFGKYGKVAKSASVFLDDSCYCGVVQKDGEVQLLRGGAVQVNGVRTVAEDDGDYLASVTNSGVSVVVNEYIDGDVEVALKDQATYAFVYNESSTAKVDIKVYSSSGTDVTGYTAITQDGNCFTAALDESKVTQPVLSLSDGDDIAGGRVTVKGANAGLVYHLNGSSTLKDGYAECAAAEATDETVTLDAGEKKLSGASGFYKVTVGLR